MAAVPILMYHSVTDRPSGEGARFAVSPGMLARQLAHLAEHGFSSVTVAELDRGRRGQVDLPARPVVLTFDDGYADFHDQVIDALAQVGFTATLFVATGLVGTRVEGDHMLAWPQVLDARDRGIEIGAHSHSHAELDKLPPGRLWAEVAGSKARLEDRLQAEVGSFAYPYGYHNRRVRQAVRSAGYARACAVRNRLGHPAEDRFRLSRMTVQWATPFEAFANLVAGRQVGAYYLYDHAAAVAWAGLRQGRALLGRAGRA
jgi:peptidoglycan/xylan/chitin deacetylase (PgdA/CDA1 family)